MNSIAGANRLVGLITILLTSLLVACGGGNDSPAAADTVAQLPITTPTATLTTSTANLRITEVTAKSSSSGAEGGWFEIYNPSTSVVNLADYSVTGSAYNNTGSPTASSIITANFELPTVSIPAGGFMVLASKVLNFLPNGPQLKYVGNTNIFPSWTANGFIELKRRADNTTVDFVRFGNSTATPTTAVEWTGAAVSSLPNGTVTAYGKSIVRLASGNYADTNAAADWVEVNFSTPGGKNDVAPGTVDTDADGVPDSAKVAGGTYAGLDLYAMGARAGQRDIFLEIHAMDQKPGAPIDVNFIPNKVALQKVVKAFADQKISLHIDAGARFSATFDPANFNLGGGNAPGGIPFSPCTDLPIGSNGVVRAECSNFFAHKNSNFDVRRRVMFSYNLFANSQETNGLAGSSGFAEIRGNDSMITMGGFGFGTTATATLTAEQNTLRYINTQASTLMHEFGHNLNLRHGGFENTNYKPNYVSVMNYMYQLVGIPGVQNNNSAGDRYQYYVDGLSTTTAPLRNSCALINSRCSAEFIIDYSNGSSTDLDEAALVGSNLIGRGTTIGSFINWSGTATLASPAYAFNVNRDFTTAAPVTPILGVLKDYNDWANIQLPFVRSVSGFNTGASSDNTARRSASIDAVRRDPMNDAAQKEFVREDPPSPQMLREIQDIALPGFRIRN